METNALIIDWTMNNYEELKSSLLEHGFNFVKEDNSEHVRVNVEYQKLDIFSDLVRKYLNAKCNYVDIQFKKEKVTVVIFIDKVFIIRNSKEDLEAKQWAISIGLPREQADWEVSF